VEEVISPIALTTLSSTQVVTGHQKGLIKLFDVGRPSSESLTFELKYQGKRKKIPISSILPLSADVMAVGSFAGNVLYVVDQR
jgi:hypothetical protein